MLYTFVDKVYFVAGATNCVICNTNTGNIYSINPTGRQIIEENRQHNHEDFWKQLEQFGLVQKTEENYEVPHFHVEEQPQPRLRFIWFEIMTSNCNEACIHCYSGSLPPAFRKKSGTESVEPSKSNAISGSRWLELIGEGCKLGATACQFIGGEPFLFKSEGQNCLDLALLYFLTYSIYKYVRKIYRKK